MESRTSETSQQPQELADRLRAVMPPQGIDAWLAEADAAEAQRRTCARAAAFYETGTWRRVLGA